MEKTICGLTPVQIEEYKKQHGAVFVSEIEELINGEPKIHRAIYREADETTMSAVTAMAKTDELKASLVLFNSCVLAADDAVKARLPLKLKVCKSITDRVTTLKESTKNL